jgi:hypothetical protein
VIQVAYGASEICLMTKDLEQNKSIPALFKTILAKKCLQISLRKVKKWPKLSAFWNLSAFHQRVILYTARKLF